VRIGLVSCKTSYPPRGGPSVHIYQVWHRLRQKGHEVCTWGPQAVPGRREYPRTETGLARLMDEVEVLYLRFPFESDFTPRMVVRMLARRRVPTVCEFNAPLYELTREWPPRTLWTLRAKVKLYARNHLLVRACVDHAICVSRVMADYVRKEFGLRRVSVLPNGGDPDLFDPGLREEGRAALGVGEEEFVVFWAGVTAWYWQGLDQVLAAARRLEGSGVRFLVTASEEELPGPLPDNLVALGRRSYFEVPRFVAAADACLALYRDYEWCPIGFYGSAMKVFDYMACGRPVIASDMGQIREVIRDGVNGFLVDGTVQEVADRIERLRREPDLRRSMGRAARESVLRRYNWQRVADRTEEILRQLLEGRGVRASAPGVRT